MSHLLSWILLFSFSVSIFAQDLSLAGFKNRFELIKNSENKVVAIKLKKAISNFTIKPFLEQLKSDLLREQQSFMGLTSSEKENQIDELLLDMGFDPLLKSSLPLEAQKLREALLNLPQVNIEEVFVGVNNRNFWKEFQAKINEAYMFIDPTLVANLEDPRFFYRKNVTYKVVEWALQQAQKRFASVPALNVATFVIVRVHEMILEQRQFHHNMLLHYFETISEVDLGMSKEEVDHAVSSIYEYRIAPMNYFESNKAAADWQNFGMDKFYMSVRTGLAKIRDWQGPLSNRNFQDIKKLNFAFAQVLSEGSKKIYHLHHNQHMLTQNPSLAYDYSRPKMVKNMRSLLNLGGVAIGFIPLPGWLKGGVETFIKSFYVEQVRMEGALVGYFESTGDTRMIESVYSQRANFYILR